MSSECAIRKYPRTPHLQGSRLQPGDEDLSQVRLGALAGYHLVVEEKVDGANCAISFSSDARMLLQSRGHFLSGGPPERHFAPLKAWASCHQEALLDVLEDRYVLYGEWMWAKHTVFYDALPHLFLEFDVLDTQTGHFLSTPARRALLAGVPLTPVPVLHEGPIGRLEELTALIGPSLYKTPDWRAALAEQAISAGVDPALALAQTNDSDLSEGLYIKHEQDGRVVGRYKWVRADFLQAILDSGSHWLERPVIANRLAPGIDIHAAGDGS